MPYDIDSVLREIEKAEARWVAKENFLTELSEEERGLHLGYVPGPQHLSLDEAEHRARTNFEAVRTTGILRAASAPTNYDLRDVSGKSYVTSVKSQGQCGSCVAFGTVAAVETQMRKDRNNPDLDVDLSEAHLFYCQARAEGRRCDGPNGGWTPPGALDCFKNTGVADEACYPYVAGDQDCTNLCTDWKNRAVKIKNWHAIDHMHDMKDWLSTRGALVTIYKVYADFQSYHSGIYKHVHGDLLGGHCVCCVGYDDTDGYWICKNSWGPRFGESGFFRIEYGQCGIDAQMWAIDGIA